MTVGVDVVVPVEVQRLEGVDPQLLRRVALLVGPAVPLPAAMLSRGTEFVCRRDGDDGYTLQSIEHFNAQPE